MKKKDIELSELFNTVVEGGYCIGCGGCASVPDSPIQMKLDDYGKFQATLKETPENNTSIPFLSICPFSDRSLNEDQIGQEIFGDECEYHNKIGYYLATYAGYVVESNYRDRGSSGGLVSWIATQLLNHDLIDGVIHIHQVNPTPEDGTLFRYNLSLTEESIHDGAKSRYYPVEMSEAIQIVRNRPGKYAIVGIPCFVKSIRLLMYQDPILAERIKFCIGLVCGHLKSTAFAKAFAWQSGIEPETIVSIDFRKKIPHAPADEYGVEIKGMKDGEIQTIVNPVKRFQIHNWGLGFFKYKACDYCDDVVAETADISIGDAWLPQYKKDGRGTNVVVVRNPVLLDILESARASGKLNLEVVDPEQIVTSQDAGFRHRHDGLAYRLSLLDKKGVWRPQKRIEPSAKYIKPILQKRFRLRMSIAQQSHMAFKNALEAGKVSMFEEIMNPLVKEYEATYLPPKSSIWLRILRGLKKILNSFGLLDE